MLLALQSYCDRSSTGQLPSSEMRELVTNDLPLSAVRAELGALAGLDLVAIYEEEIERTGLDGLSKTKSPGKQFWWLTSSGIDACDAARGEGIPAADRFVARNDNAMEFDQTLASLEDLEAKLVQANGMFDTEANRQAAIAEVRGFKSMLQNGTVRAIALSAARISLSGLRDFAKKVGNGLVENAAAIAVAAIAALLARMF